MRWECIKATLYPDLCRKKGDLVTLRRQFEERRVSGKESQRLMHSWGSEQDEGSVAALRGRGMEGSYLKHRMPLKGKRNPSGDSCSSGSCSYEVQPYMVPSSQL